MPKARKAQTQTAGRVGLFRTNGTDDDRRDDPPVQPQVPNGSGNDEGEFDGSIRDELLRLLKLPAAVLEQTPDLTVTSGGALLARVLLQKAVIDKNQNAITEVLDRIEGKATKAAANKPSNSHIQEQIALSIEDLNKL